MIVGVTGTSVAFGRFVEALAAYARANPEERVWVQHGEASLPSPLEGESLLPREELLERMRGADVVVCHGGSGTLFDALALGHIPVVVPRRHHLGEHVNDHQLELGDALQEQGRAVVVEDLATLGAAIARARSSKQAPPTDVALRLRDSLRLESTQLASKSLRANWTWRALRVLTALVPRTFVPRP